MKLIPYASLLALALVHIGMNVRGCRRIASRLNIIGSNLDAKLTTIEDEMAEAKRRFKLSERGSR